MLYSVIYRERLEPCDCLDIVEARDHASAEALAWERHPMAEALRVFVLRSKTHFDFDIK